MARSSDGDEEGNGEDVENAEPPPEARGCESWAESAALRLTASLKGPSATCVQSVRFSNHPDNHPQEAAQRALRHHAPSVTPRGAWRGRGRSGLLGTAP